MKTILSWLRAKLTRQADSEHEAISFVPPTSPKPQYNIKFYQNAYSLIAEGVRLKLVEAMFNLNLFALFEKSPCILESDIIKALKLHPLRAKKWLHLLASEHFLIKIKSKDSQLSYALPEELVQLIKKEEWWAITFFFNSWIVAANENLTDVLCHGEIKTSVSWPPKTTGQAKWLEDWMRNTAKQPLDELLKNINFKAVNSVLDVGGGDGTIACALVDAYPHLQVSVYNLPLSAAIARATINAQRLSHKVHVVEGDFIAEDAFPVGFDLILFTRVLFDWNEVVAQKLLRMAYLALQKDGLVAICEFYKEENNDGCLAAEYRYIFHDDFAPNVMKTAASYRMMLKEIGFSIILPNTEKKPSLMCCSVILAQKK